MELHLSVTDDLNCLFCCTGNISLIRYFGADFLIELNMTSYFIVNSLMDLQPMQVLDTVCNMVISPQVTNNPTGHILNLLEFVELEF